MAVTSGEDASGDNAIGVITSSQQPENTLSSECNLIPSLPPKVTLFDRARATGEQIKLKVDRFLEEFRLQHYER